MSYPVTVDIDVLWGDLDALGHVNNTRFFTWFESARIAAFARIGMTVDNPGAVGPILATTTCDFMQALTYPDELTVGCRIPRVGNTSFGMEYAIWRRGHPDDRVAKGSGVIVLVNYKTGEKVRVPDDIRAAIDALSQ